jgi:hypothetical protein
MFLYRSEIKLPNGSIWPAAFHISLTKVVPGQPYLHVKLTAAVNIPWLAWLSVSHRRRRGESLGSEETKCQGSLGSTEQSAFSIRTP